MTQRRRTQLIISILVFLLIGLVIYLQTPSQPITPSLPITTTTPVITQITPTVAGISTASVTSTDWYELYFTSPVIPFDKVTTGGIENHLIDKINTSQKSIDAATFEFDLDNVAQALIKAKERGVKVRLVYDDEYTNPDPQMGNMMGQGIPAVADHRSAYMHNKFFIIDGQCVWTGSFNITINAAYKNNENAFYLCSPEMVANYQTEFDELYSGKFGPGSPDNTPHHIFESHNVTIENYFSPDDHVMDQVIKAVSKANSSIHFMAYSFTDDELAQTMISRNQNRVEVSGIFESKNATAQSSECNNLLSQGIPVFLDGNPATFHHKIIIIDGKTVIFGSFNFTANADDSNDENLLVIHDQGIAQKFEQEYNRRLSEAKKPVGGVCKSQ